MNCSQNKSIKSSHMEEPVATNHPISGVLVKPMVGSALWWVKTWNQRLVGMFNSFGTTWSGSKWKENGLFVPICVDFLWSRFAYNNNIKLKKIIYQHISFSWIFFDISHRKYELMTQKRLRPGFKKILWWSNRRIIFYG